MWFSAVIFCLVMALVVAVLGIKDQRGKGRGPISSFFIGCCTGGFFGGFLLVALLVIYIVVV